MQRFIREVGRLIAQGGRVLPPPPPPPTPSRSPSLPVLELLPKRFALDLAWLADDGVTRRANHPLVVWENMAKGGNGEGWGVSGD